MSDKTKDITDATFAETIKSGVALVDFWAPWCGPCRTQGPILDQVAEEIGDKAIIAKMNVDENTSAPAKFGVRSIPTLILFKDGSAVQQFVGVTSKEKLLESINSNL